MRGKAQALRVWLAAALWLPLLANAVTLDDARELHRNGNLNDALAAYRAVTRAAAGDSDIAVAHNNACVILMNRGDYRAARDECLQARRLREALGDESRLARTLNNLGTVLEALGEYEQAQAVYRQALSINQRAGDMLAQTINLSNLGVLAMRRGKFSEALERHEAALQIALANAGENWSNEQRLFALVNRGVVLERLGSYREALQTYTQVLASEAQLDPSRAMALRVNIGVVYRNLGDPVRALAVFKASIEGAGEDAAANAWLNIGIVQHQNLGRPAEAEQAFRNALRLARKSGDLAEEIQGMYSLGRLLLDAGKSAEAQQVFSQCLAKAQSSESPEGRWSALEGLARVHLALGEHQVALQYAERAIALFEAVRSELDDSALRQTYFGEKRAVYSLAVSILWQLEMLQPGVGHAGKAFLLSQQAKARELLEAMGSNKQLAVPVPQEEVRARLNRGIVMEYFVGEREVFLWTLERDAFHMFNLGSLEAIRLSVTTAHRSLARGSMPQAAALDALSSALMLPAAQQLARHTRLRIAPDGSLHYLPFELLSADLSPGLSLGESHVVTYLPSASAGQWLKPPGRAKVMLAGFADATVETAAAGYERRDLIHRFALKPLPETRQELSALARMLPGEKTLRVGDEASERAFREAVRDGARIVHVAGHTVMDETPGRGAAIVLSPDGEDDGLLYPQEIAGLDYNATLTVLAACRTALGGTDDGRVLASLTGSLLAAGSSAVVATLWDVDDYAASVFMQQFYFHLARGLAPAAALQKTRHSFRNDARWQHTMDWAGFVLIGEAPPLVSRPFRYGWLAAAALLLLLLAAIQRRARRSR